MSAVKQVEHRESGVSDQRVEQQLIRARRWRLPRRMEAYGEAVRPSQVAVQIRCSPEPPHIHNGHLFVIALTCSVVLHVVVGIWLGWFVMVVPARSPEDFLIVVAEQREAAPLESLPVDIGTLSGVEPAWDHFDKPIAVALDPSARPLSGDSVVLADPGRVDVAADFGDPAPPGLRGAADRPLERDVASFFGVRARGRRFVFVIDNTLSMLGEPWETVVDETAAAVARLQVGQQFAVVLLDGSTWQLQNADRQSAARVTGWLQDAPLIALPDGQGALGRALDLRPDAIYVISNRGFTMRSVRMLRSQNKLVEEDRVKLPGSVLHAISIHEALDAEVLQDMAAENEGHYYRLPPQRAAETVVAPAASNPNSETRNPKQAPSSNSK